MRKLTHSNSAAVVFAAAPDPVMPSYELYQAARANRPYVVGDFIVAAIRAAVAVARRARTFYGQCRQARSIRAALHELDDRTLRDLGFHRDEISSIAAEATGLAERSRVRVLLMSHTLP